jgi:G3E family GTPase
LITRLIGRGRQDTAVLVNEFSGLAIDQDIFEINGIPAVALSGGCICCAVRGEVRKGLQALLFAQACGSSARVGRVIVETSGLADPLSLVEEFLTDSVLLRRFRLAGVLTVADATMPQRYFEESRTTRNQIAAADRLIISKDDLPNANASAVAEAIRRINGTAPLSRSEEISESRSELFDPVGLQHRPMQSRLFRMNDHDPLEMRSLCIEDAVGNSADCLLAFVEELIEACGAALVRLKGIAQLDTVAGALIVHVVRGRLYPAQQLKTRMPVDRPRLIAIIASTHVEMAIRRAKAHGLALVG